MTREPKFTDRVYRVGILHQYADANGYYQHRIYGPYTTLSAAKSQAKRLLNEARRDSRKADSYIESSLLDWEEVTR